MEWQVLFNFGMGVLLAGTGWFARVVWDEVQNLKQQHSDLRVQLPTLYVTKTEHNDGLERVERRVESGHKEIKGMLQRITDQMNGKADKQ